MAIEPEELFGKDNENENRGIHTKRSPKKDRSGGVSVK